MWFGATDPSMAGRQYWEDSPWHRSIKGTTSSGPERGETQPSGSWPSEAGKEGAKKSHQLQQLLFPLS